MEKGTITVIKEKWDQLLSDEKKIRLILLVGLLGMLLIFLSGTGKEKSSQVPQNAVAVNSVDNESFCRQTEDKILQLIGRILGLVKELLLNADHNLGRCLYSKLVGDEGGGVVIHHLVNGCHHT